MNIRDTRVRPITTVLAVLALVVGVAGPAVAAPPTPARPDRPDAPVDPPECEEDGSATHPEVGCGDDTGDPDTPPGQPGEPGGPGIDPAEACAEYEGWDDCQAFVALNGLHPADMCGYMIDPHQDWLDYYQPDAPEGAVLRTWICPREGTFYTEDTDWIMGSVPLPPDPEDVAEDVWAEVQATLLHPALETWPPQNMSSVLDLPTFVSVSNWQGEQHERGCDTGICVNLTATPALSLDPGDGSAAVACEPGGTRFDRLGADPDDQAAGDACAHVYTRRTGVANRPDAWPGVVGITWTVEWQEEGGAEESGEIGPLVLSTPLPRVVTELLSVVTDITPTGQG